MVCETICTFFAFFNVFFKIQKKHHFLRFFELLHTFSRTVLVGEQAACRLPNPGTDVHGFHFLASRPSTRHTGDYRWQINTRRYLFLYVCQLCSVVITSLQRRALQVIIGNIPCEEACCKLNLPRLADRRHSLCRTLFQQITNRESHILHYLLIPGKARR